MRGRVGGREGLVSFEGRDELDRRGVLGIFVPF